MTKLNRTKGFTLIELLMVIAIIGILAGILIPTVGAVRKQANIAASKAQLSNYVTAFTMFKGEYGYYPLVTGTGDTTELDLSSGTNSADFMETLSGRNPTTGAPVTNGGNRRRIAFHSFSESELQRNASDVVVPNQVADRFNNPNIIIVVDTNGDGFVTPSGPSSSEVAIKTAVTAYVSKAGNEEFEDYKLWD